MRRRTVLGTKCAAHVERAKDQDHRRQSLLRNHSFEADLLIGIRKSIVLSRDISMRRDSKLVDEGVAQHGRELPRSKQVAVELLIVPAPHLPPSDRLLSRMPGVEEPACYSVPERRNPIDVADILVICIFRRLAIQN